ncbi:MAG: hypothetical protein HN368_23425, partial [Spirochaetales bacterium]|nr:hypothetical protein [Spirochaetales bacterium]
MSKSLKSTVAAILIVFVITSCGLFAPKQSFSVGGEVTGLLDGNSLVLQLNGNEQLTINENGTFLFPTQVSLGAEYSVIVVTQPAGQTCTLSGAIGVMPAGPVSDVLAEVATNTYSVSGTLSGLPASESLVLQLNGANDLTLTADGAFTFTPAFEYNTNYVVTAASEPSGYMAVIDNASGLIPAGDVGNIVITCTIRTYSIGGTVTGISTGDVIALTLNAGTPLNIAANGIFEFPERLTSGVVYNVAVDTEPSGKSVSLSNSTGMVSSSDVTDIGVAVTIPLTESIDAPQALAVGTYEVPNNTTITINDALTIFAGTTIIFGAD